jgi:hypothetical protein
MPAALARTSAPDTGGGGLLLPAPMVLLGVPLPPSTLLLLLPAFAVSLTVLWLLLLLEPPFWMLLLVCSGCFPPLPSGCCSRPADVLLAAVPAFSGCWALGNFVTCCGCTADGRREAAAHAAAPAPGAVESPCGRLLLAGPMRRAGSLASSPA